MATDRRWPLISSGRQESFDCTLLGKSVDHEAIYINLKTEKKLILFTSSKDDYNSYIHVYMYNPFNP